MAPSNDPYIDDIANLANPTRPNVIGASSGSVDDNAMVLPPRQDIEQDVTGAPRAQPVPFDVFANDPMSMAGYDGAPVDEQPFPNEQQIIGADQPPSDPVFIKTTPEILGPYTSRAERERLRQISQFDKVYSTALNFDDFRASKGITERRAKGGINTAFLKTVVGEDISGSPRDPARMAAIRLVGEKMFKGQGVKDEDTLFQAIQGQATKHKDEKELFAEIQRVGAKSAYFGPDGLSAVDSEWQAIKSRPGYDPTRAPEYIKAAREAQNRVSDSIDPYRDQLNAIIGGFKRGNIESVVGDIILQADEDEWRGALEAAKIYAATLPDDEAESFLGGMYKSFERMSTAMVTGAGEVIYGAAMESMSASEDTLAGKAGAVGAGLLKGGGIGVSKALAEQAAPSTELQKTIASEKLRDFTKLRNRLTEARNVLETQYDPIDQQGILGWIQSAPTVAAQSLGMAGSQALMPLLYTTVKSGTQRSLYIQAREQGMSEDGAAAYADIVSDVSVVPNMAFERVQAILPMGKIPGVGKWVNKLGNSFNNRIARAGARIIGTTAAEAAVEVGQDISDTSVQELASWLSEELPQVEWRQETVEAFKRYPEYAVSMILLSGLSAVEGNQIDTASRTVKENMTREELIMVGGRPEDVDALLAAEGQNDLNEAYTQLVQNRDPNSETALAQIKQAEQEWEAGKAQRDAQAKAGMALPDFTLGTDGKWKVTDRESGEVLGEGLNMQQAMTTAQEATMLKNDKKGRLTAQLFDLLEVTESTSSKTLETVLQPFFDANESTIQEYVQNGEQAMLEQAQIMGMSSDGQSILGVSIPEMKSRGRGAVNRIFKGGNVLTVFHEEAHKLYRDAQRAGLLTPEQVKEAIVAIDAQIRDGKAERFIRPEQKAAGARLGLLPDGFEGMTAEQQAKAVDEALSELVEVETLRRRKTGGIGGRLSPGMISRALSNQAALGSNGKSLLSLKGFVDTLKTFFGVQLARLMEMKRAIKEGRIDEAQLDALLDTLYGMDGQAEMEAKAKAETKAILAAKPAEQLITPEVGTLPPATLVNVTNRDAIPGKSYAVPPNVVFIQPRNLDTRPMSGQILTYPYDGTAEDAARVASQAYMEVQETFYDMSQRESIFGASGPDGKMLHQMFMDQVHGQVRVKTFGQATSAQQADTPFSIAVTPAMDAAYMAAVESGDMDTAQKMVDEAANGAPKVIRGDAESFFVFDPSKRGGSTKTEAAKRAFFFTDSPREAEAYAARANIQGGKTGQFFLLGEGKVMPAGQNPNDMVEELERLEKSGFDYVVFPESSDSIDPDNYTDITIEGRRIYADPRGILIDQVADALQAGESERIAIADELQSYMDEYDTKEDAEADNPGYTSLIEALRNNPSSIGIQDASTSTVYAAFNAQKIKDASPVTRDDTGKVIPLSERFNEESADIRFSISPINHVYLRNQDRFNELRDEGRINVGADVASFEGKNIVLHQPDTAFAGEVQFDGDTLVEGKGGVYYPVLFADKNYFWASTEFAAKSMAKMLNEVGQRNGGKILMGLTSAGVDKLFSSTTMSTGTVNFFAKLAESPRKYGITKAKLNQMLVAASKVEFIKPNGSVATFKETLKAKDGIDANLAKIKELLAADQSIFAVRKAFVELLVQNVASHLSGNPEASQAVAQILAGENNQYAKAAIKRGKLSKASILQGLGDMFSEPMVKTFQKFDAAGGNLYAIIELDGEVEAIETDEHESYPFAIVSKDGTPVKVNVLKEAMAWENVVGDMETGDYVPEADKKKMFPSTGVSKNTLQVLKPKPDTATVPMAFQIGPAAMTEAVTDAVYRLAKKEPAAKQRIFENILSRLNKLKQFIDERDHAYNFDAFGQKVDGEFSEEKTSMLNALAILQGLRAALPMEVRAKVGGDIQLVKYDTDEKRMAYLKDKVKSIEKHVDRWLHKEYNTLLDQVFKREQPKVEAGKKAKGKAGPQIHAIFTKLKEMRKASQEEVDAHVAGIDAKMASGYDDVETEIQKSMEAALVALVGNWREATLERKAQAVNAVRQAFESGYYTFRLQKLMEKEDRQIAVDTLRKQTGNKGDAASRSKRALKQNNLKGKWKDVLVDLLSFDQIMELAFGKDSELANKYVTLERKASEYKEDFIQNRMDAIEQLFTKMAGGSLAGEKLRWAMAQKTIDIDGLKLSQMEAIQATMMWRQEDGRRHMMGLRDENGKPLKDSWSYDQAWVDKVEAALTEESKQFRAHIANVYGNEWNEINPTYKQLEGIDLPQNKYYSPLTVKPQNTSGNEMVDPLTGFAVSAGSVTPSSLRTRGSSVAEPDFKDAMQLFIGHSKQIGHWIAYAPLMKDFGSVIRRRELLNSVEGAYGEHTARTLRKWNDWFQNGGVLDAAAHTKLNGFVGRMVGRTSGAILAGRISVLVIQSTQLMASLAQMPVHSFLGRFAKLMSGQLEWKAAFKSEYIQRRLKQQPVMVQEAMKGLAASKPNRIKWVVRRIGDLIGGMDALMTAGSYAIIHDYKLKQAMEMGLDGAQAEAYAASQTEAAVDQIAQPTRSGARSYLENVATNPLYKMLWAFGSEGRQKLALGLFRTVSKDRSMTEKGRALAVTWLVGGMMATMIRAALRDLKDDDEDNDERIYDPTRLLLASATGPIQGVPFLGEMAEKAIYEAVGVWKYDSSILDSVTELARPIKEIPEWDEKEAGEILKDVEKLLGGMAPLNDTIAASASLSHLARDVYDIGENLLGDD